MNKTINNNHNSNAITQSDLTKQPKGLLILFFAEIWERFSFYGIRALLVLYMTKQLMFSDVQAYGIYGAYGAMVYGASIIGGYVADHLTGSRYTVFLGGIIITIGHFFIAVPPSYMGLTPTDTLFIGLALIVMGTGFFKSNIAVLLGQLYQKNDKRRDSGYTLLYMGINIGSFLAPILCGFVGENIGWHYGFSLAGIGMFFGLIIIYHGRKYLDVAGMHPAYTFQPSSWFGKNMKLVILMGTILSIPLFTYAIHHSEFSNYILNFFAVLSLVTILYCIYKSPKEEQKCLWTLLAMFPFITCFFACFEQCGTSMSLYADRYVDRSFVGFTIPTSWFLSINPAFIILIAPMVAGLWNKLSRINKNPLPPIKFALGLVQIGLGFATMLMAIRTTQLNTNASMWWLVLSYLLHATGELCISPMGLSMVSKISPARLTGFMMGCFYLSIAFSHLVAAAVAKLSSNPTGISASIENRALLIEGFYKAFEVSFYLATVSGLVLFLISPLFKGVFQRHQ